MKVLVKADSPSWAFAKRSEAYSLYPPEGWSVGMGNDSFPRTDEDWDAVLLLDCTASPLAYGDVAYARMIGSHAWTCVPSSFDWRTRGSNESRCLDRVKAMLGRCSVAAVYNQSQRAALMDLGIRQRIVVAPYSVDCQRFAATSRTNRATLRCGWNYQVSGGLNSFKGLSDVLVPLIAELGKEVEWSVLTPESKSCMSTNQLIEWYEGIDIFLCTSSAEGGPQGPFEAAACGCAVLSTDVGQVTDWAGLRKCELIVPTYRNALEAAATVQAMAQKIRMLNKDRPLLEAMSSYLAADIRLNWNAEVLCPLQLKEIFGS